jgi:hypothetical protein
MAENLTTLMCQLSRNLGASTSWNPLGLSRPVMGLLYLNWHMKCILKRHKHRSISCMTVVRIYFTNVLQREVRSAVPAYVTHKREERQLIAPPDLWTVRWKALGSISHTPSLTWWRVHVYRLPQSSPFQLALNHIQYVHRCKVSEPRTRSTFTRELYITH